MAKSDVVEERLNNHIKFFWCIITAVAGALAYMAVELNHINERLGELAGLNAKVTKVELQSQASLPQSVFDKTLPDLRTAVATARKDNVRISPRVIQDLNARLLRTASDAPDFWPTLSEFINYRSLVASVPPEKVNKLLSGKIADCTDLPPKPMTVLSTTEMSKGSYEDCRFVIDSEEQDEKLNAILKTHTAIIVFRNCLIEYHGGDINLILAWNKEPLNVMLTPPRGSHEAPIPMHFSLTGPAIEFQNCLFNFTFKNAPSSNGQLLSTALLGQDAASASLPAAI
jgi:hypothetical protein